MVTALITDYAIQLHIRHKKWETTNSKRGRPSKRKIVKKKEKKRK